MFWIQENEASLRLLSFVSILLLMAILEFAFPRRKLLNRKKRWLTNFSFGAMNTIILRTGLPLLAVGAASLAETNLWGVFPQLNLPLSFTIPLGILLLDLLVFLQHLVFHHVPFLWRLHRVHHTDLEFDLSTAVRFHPIEIILSMLIKIAFVIGLGVPVLAVICFEIILSSTSIFNHSNFFIPLQADRFLRLFLVTPDMHRIHHSVEPKETNSNFGFNLPWWDHIFRTYRAKPESPQSEMLIGLKEFRQKENQGAFALLLNPFRRSI